MKRAAKTKKLERRKEWRQQARSHPVLTAVYFVLRAIVMVALVSAVLRRAYESAFVCGLVLVLFTLPSLMEKRLKIDIPTPLEIVILLFIFAAEILGELQSYYIHFPYWDTILHTTNGFICAAFGFALVDILTRNKQEKFRLSPLYMALGAFCFSMTVGVLWEFFEYGMDTLFLMDMQKDTVIHTIPTVTLDPTQSNKVVVLDNITSVIVNGQELGLGGYLDIGLHDTMMDLFVNFIGAVVFSVIGFVYIKQRGKGRVGFFAKQFIPALTEEASHGTDEDTATD